MKFTQSNIAKLKIDNGKPEQIFLDDELSGFGLRIRAAGSRKYVVHYRLGERRCRHTIGKADAWTLEDARKEARRILVAVDNGNDPASSKASKRAAAALLFSTVKADYLAARKPNMKPRSYEECERHLNNHWKLLHSMSIASIDRPTVAARLRIIAKDSGPVAADRARSTLSAMFAWSIGEGLCDTNPVDGTNTASDGKARERVLTDAELAAIWTAAPATSYGRIVRLLMLTAQRRDEIGSLRWSELEGEGATALIALPSARTKNSRQHDVPLAAAALDVLAEAPRTDDRDLVFGEGAGGYSGWSRSKEALDALCGVKDWTLHDLRRTAATRMADSGVQPHVIEAVLNHVSGHKGGVAGIYNRSTYAAEKRQALDVLASYIRAAAAKAAGANVTRLRA